MNLLLVEVESRFERFYMIDKYINVLAWVR